MTAESAAQASHAKPAGDLGHLGLAQVFCLLDRLLHAKKHGFFEEFRMLGIDDLNN